MTTNAKAMAPILVALACAAAAACGGEVEQTTEPPPPDESEQRKAYAAEVRDYAEGLSRLCARKDDRVTTTIDGATRGGAMAVAFSLDRNGVGSAFGAVPASEAELASLFGKHEPAMQKAWSTTRGWSSALVMPDVDWKAIRTFGHAAVAAGAGAVEFSLPARPAVEPIPPPRTRFTADLEDVRRSADPGAVADLARDVFPACPEMVSWVELHVMKEPKTRLCRLFKGALESILSENPACRVPIDEMKAFAWAAFYEEPLGRSVFAFWSPAEPIPEGAEPRRALECLDDAVFGQVTAWWVGERKRLGAVKIHGLGALTGGGAGAGATCRLVRLPGGK